MEEEAP
jgi:hypothetical protein